MSQSELTGPKVEIQTWPGLALCLALQMVLSVDELPGIGEDFEALASGISAPLADSILLFLLTNMPAALIDLSLQEQVTDLAPEGFLDWVEGLDTAELVNHAQAWDHRKRDDRHEAVRSPKSPESEDPADWLREKATKAQLTRVRQVLGDPASLKEMVTTVLRAFWEDHFQAVYARHSDAMSRAVEEIRYHEQPDNLPLLLESLLARPIPIAADWINQHDRILLVPFPFMGPYLVSMSMEEPEPMLIFTFDAERVMGLQAAGDMGPDISKLKALADETRLKILRFASKSERFGGDIVTHLGISQPGVSRHLRLLTASGLLRVRQEGASKYYSVCDAELDVIADGIRQLKSDSKNNK